MWFQETKLTIFSKLCFFLPSESFATHTRSYRGGALASGDRRYGTSYTKPTIAAIRGMTCGTVIQRKRVVSSRQLRKSSVSLSARPCDKRWVSAPVFKHSFWFLQNNTDLCPQQQKMHFVDYNVIRTERTDVSCQLTSSICVCVLPTLWLGLSLIAGSIIDSSADYFHDWITRLVFTVSKTIRKMNITTPTIINEGANPCSCRRMFDLLV